MTKRLFFPNGHFRLEMIEYVFRMICDGDKCIVGFNQEFKVYTVKKGKSARFKKHDFNWTGCIGQPYG